MPAEFARAPENFIAAKRWMHAECIILMTETLPLTSRF
jgi:hypothetical protein